MLDPDEVVAKDHLRRRDAELLGHPLDRAGLEDGQFARCDAEAEVREGAGGVVIIVVSSVVAGSNVVIVVACVLLGVRGWWEGLRGCCR